MKNQINQAKTQLAFIKWLLPKCKYAIEKGSEEYIRERFIQLIFACQDLINAESEVKK